MGLLGTDHESSCRLNLAAGKTSATLVLFKEYLRIVDRVHLVSGTLIIAPKYVEMSQMVRDKYKREGIDLDDPMEILFMKTCKPCPLFFKAWWSARAKPSRTGTNTCP